MTTKVPVLGPPIANSCSTLEFHPQHRSQLPAPPRAPGREVAEWQQQDIAANEERGPVRLLDFSQYTLVRLVQ